MDEGSELIQQRIQKLESLKKEGRDLFPNNKRIGGSGLAF
jgi:hypothetical protein